MQHVLVVEDDEDLAVPLAHLFEAAGFEASVVARGEDAITHVGDVDTDMVILDLVLPDMDGVEVCGTLRESGFSGGLIMVTARGDELDVVAGLDAGADDYLAKPVSVAELQSRVRSVLRRIHRSYDRPPGSTPGTPSLEITEHQITYGGREVVTSGREYDVLALLVAHRGQVVTRERFMDEVWGSDWSGSPMVLPSAIARIRERLATAGAPERIENVRGIGFRLASR
ncbi:response regulator transcription factor [Nocardioides sp. SYSU D00065]|uniref:response regulator transcription factor n=1 Tax=Nocardioides sp. SYSU D00065 TaxID=2817378 RepID=UPI001B332C21|nr:response regulator transcription factor [Nocardioides sp. SYSU D00065]